jgi:hypothetical protein
MPDERFFTAWWNVARLSPWQSETTCADPLSTHLNCGATPELSSLGTFKPINETARFGFLHEKEQQGQAQGGIPAP